MPIRGIHCECCDGGGGAAGPCRGADAADVSEAVSEEVGRLRRAIDGFRWLGNNLHNIKEAPDGFREMYEAALKDAEEAVGVRPTN